MHIIHGNVILPRISLHQGRHSHILVISTNIMPAEAGMNSFIHHLSFWPAMTRVTCLPVIRCAGQPFSCAVSRLSVYCMTQFDDIDRPAVPYFYHRIKNIARHTKRTIDSLHNTKQWLMIHTSDFTVITRWNIHYHSHHKRIGYAKDTEHRKCQDYVYIK